IRKFGKVLGEFIGVQPYQNWQKAFDPLLAPGSRNYWKSHNFTEISEGAIDVTMKYVSKLPSSQCEIFFGQIGAATTRKQKNATAYSHRDAIWVCNVHGRWENAADDKKIIEWSRGFFNDAAPFASAGAYVNFLTDDEGERVRSAYGPSYQKLVKIKRKYDPENLFRMNQNISPGK
ncbi:MAG: BBE domain-containing protein, partial [Candidatus Zixiibacteriota bacterium]